MKIQTPDNFPWYAAQGICRICGTTITLDNSDRPDEDKISGKVTFIVPCPNCKRPVQCSKSKDRVTYK